MKKDKQFYSWLFAVIVLSVLLVICFYLGISGWFFSNEKEKVTDFQLGNNIEIEVHKNSANSISLNLNGGYLGGEKLKQVVAIKNLAIWMFMLGQGLLCILLKMNINRFL